MKRLGLLFFGILVAALTGGGCGTSKCADGSCDETPPVIGKSLAALTTADGCDEVLALLKAETLKDVEKVVDANRDWVLQMTKQDYGWCMYAEDGTGGTPSSNGGDKGGARDYSTTNTQEAGVDEADFVKNDAKFIYVLADGKLQIIEAWPAATARKVATVAIEGTPSMMYVEGDRIVVYSGTGPVQQGTSDVYGPGMWYGGMPYYQGGGLCTYGYDCEFTGDGQRLKITEFQVNADRTELTLLRETRFSGSYLNSRRIGKIVHTVVVFPEVSVPGVTYWPEELKDFYNWCGQETFPFTEAQIIDMFDALKTANLQKVRDSDITDYLPGIQDTRYVDGQAVTEEGLLGDCQGFYLSKAGDGRSFLSLASFDMSKPGSIGASTIVGRPGAVYGSLDNLYVAERHYQNDMTVGWYYPQSEGAIEATTVHKFRLSDGQATTQYVGSGVVKGRVLNQFALDEQDGYLRVATTMGQVPDPNVYSTVSVLKDIGGELAVVGMVDHIAPTEDIRSARFEGDAVFIVTFKKTDPLFAFDLSDPLDPKLLGALEIPGFSTYMHFLDPGHILSIGYDADDMGDFAWFDGLQLQVFDVTDLTKPTLLHRQIIGTRGSTSDAATNHLAFNFFRSRNLLALPIIVCEGGGDGQSGTTMSFNGLQVWRVTVENGFFSMGGIPHSAPVTGDSYNSVCGSWWSQSNSQVKRSVFMEDWVYSIALDKIEIANLIDLEHPAIEIPLAPPPVN